MVHGSIGAGHVCCSHLVAEMAWQVSSGPEVPVISCVAGAGF